ncbi:hypothetical protein [Streptomyces shenzhenensis]|uniref:hypothetical protein n=1 Tax=Streptomyces shenzhenensis TaxID=943815 RepID=UPI0033CC7038
MTSSIARRASLALASAAVAVASLLATGGSASAAAAAPGSGSPAVSHTDRTPGPQHWEELCKQVNRVGGVKIVPRTDQQGHAGDAARIRWISDQIAWLCSHV